MKPLDWKRRFPKEERGVSDLDEEHQILNVFVLLAILKSEEQGYEKT
jgi:hypothetical protein